MALHIGSNAGINIGRRSFDHKNEDFKGRVRLANVEDVPKIMRLVTESMSLNFRVKEPGDIITLIETSVLSICQLDIQQNIVGFLAAKDYPLLPSVLPGAWEDFVWNKYKVIDMNARNTLFLHMLCFDPAYGRDVVDKMLRSVFMHDPYVHYVGMVRLLVHHQALCVGQARCEASFKKIQTLERGVSSDRVPWLSVAERKEVCPRLRIRRAVEEDNDDIVPIIELHSTRLRELYGDFYISELISRHPESERVLLVCEHKEVAVGVMCLNTQINYEALEESYELSPFAGLRHIESTPGQVTDRKFDSTTCVADFNLTATSDNEAPSKEQKSRIMWAGQEGTKPSAEHLPLDSAGMSQLDILSLLEDEDDEFEYDIINIDTSLLMLPQLCTSDDLNNYDRDESLASKGSAMELKNLFKDKKKRMSTSTTQICLSKIPEPKRYSGAPNAFLIELFVMHPHYDERYGFDMLEAAYELFPGRDYCIMSLPSSHPSFPLLEHFTLVTPFGFRLRFIHESLFVAHVNSVKGDLRVRPAEECDIGSMSRILQHSPKKSDLMALFYDSISSKTLSSYALLSQNQPIGLVLLGPLEGSIAIRSQFDLETETKRPDTDGAILVGVMSPIMEPHARWYLRDILRQSKYTTLFWICRLFAKGDSSPGKNLMSLAGHMLPVRPRRRLLNVIENKEDDKILKDNTYAVWSIERPLTSLPKVAINTSILVVGASRSGLAFLETLLFGPSSAYLTFTNVTLVSEGGLPVSEGLRAADTCIPRTSRYSDRYLKSLPFYYYIDVITAVVVKIDRKKKCVHLQGGAVKFYDDLVLTCGRQFQQPNYLRESWMLAKEIQRGKPCDRIPMDNASYRPDQVPLAPEPYDNVLVFNSQSDANVGLVKLLWMISVAKNTPIAMSENNPVVVYGDCVEAYCCIAGLLEIGVTADCILFIEPFPAEEESSMRINCFNNETVDERVQEKLAALGVKVYRKCYLQNLSAFDTRVDSLWLMTPTHMQNISCFALFYYGWKAIDLNTFKATNECGLVYEVGVVVGAGFETNDPHVYAAGSCTQYSRRLLTNVHQRHYCSEDVGEALGQIFLNRLDPFLNDDSNTDSSTTPAYRSTSLGRPKLSSVSVKSVSPLGSHVSRQWQPVLKFDSPIVLTATLPGPLYYMTLRKPGIDLPKAVQQLLSDQGHSLITDKDENYFHLQLNALHRVESLCCLSHKPFPYEAFVQLYRQHDASLNNILYRFHMNLIDDLYEYFTQPWITGLYQEQIDKLFDDIDEHGGQKVYDFVKSKYPELYRDGATETKGERKLFFSADKQCGQNKSLCCEAAKFWKAIDGNGIVKMSLTKYLLNNGIWNPQYAIPELK